MILDHAAFEAWVIEHYPEIFEKWELTASEYVDLECFIKGEDYRILDEWKGKE